MTQGVPTGVKTIMSIRRDYARGVSQQVLADLYGIARSTVQGAVAGDYPGLGLGSISRGRGRPRKQ
jgi:hypothetical protein